MNRDEQCRGAVAAAIGAANAMVEPMRQATAGHDVTLGERTGGKTTAQTGVATGEP